MARTHLNGSRSNKNHKNHRTSSSQISSSTTNDSNTKKLSMKERLAMWKKHKEELETASSSRPSSRASSTAGIETENSSNSTSTNQFVAAPATPSSVAKKEPTVKKFTGLKRKLPVGGRSGKEGGGLKMSRPDRPSLLSKQSVFGSTGNEDDEETTTEVNVKKPAILPLPSRATTEADEDTMDVVDDAPDSLEQFMTSVGTMVEDSSQSKDVAGNYNEDEDDIASPGIDKDADDLLALAARKQKKKDLVAVDHSKMNYESFKRNFYIEPAELRNLSAEEVDMMRVDLGGIKIRGVDPPVPATSWSQFGLPAACADVIKYQGFEKPTPVQAQAIPAILSGRDVISVAKTGSGKTLAFILPMLRHIKAQRPLAQNEGPIGLVMTPTRELAVQIHRECKPFLKPLGLRGVCAYGGSAIKDQIAELKRGAEIVVCTPGRLIDLLCANSGRLTNLHRVTFMVLDEADRMFDMGFEPQVTKIIQNVRPSRQTVLFSATFPRQMEALARKILRRPLEIVVGGRALIPPEVTQHVEVVETKDKFVRLLSVLGNSFNSNAGTLALVFVDRQEAADVLLKDLMRRGYVCNSLHGGKDQTDRDQAIADFKNRVFSVLIATSVAARGLDVRGLNVVINYDCPNHMEDLVHRVGRTGRAGNKGDAFTFVTPDQDRYASEVVKAMKLSGLTPPEDIKQLADSFMEKVRQGKERYGKRSGFGGKGLEKLVKDRNMMKKIQKVTYGQGDDEDDDEEEDEEEKEAKKEEKRKPAVSSTKAKPAENTALPDVAKAAILAAQAAARRLNIAAEHGSKTTLSAVDQVNQQLGILPKPKTPTSTSTVNSLAAATAVAASLSSTSAATPTTPTTSIVPVGAFSRELDINDYPQKARWRATNRETLAQIIEQTGAAITTRGLFVPPGKSMPENGERKLYLYIEADNERAAEQAKGEIKRILTEATLQIMEQEGTSGRYSVV